MHYQLEDYEDTDILLAVKLEDFIGNSIYIALSISAIIGWGIILLQIYIFRRLRWEEESSKTSASVSLKSLYWTMLPGIITVLLVTIIFSYMLMLLENQTNASIIAMNKRRAVQDEIEWNHSQESLIRSTFVNFYRTHTQVLASFLKEHPDYMTREGLQELNRIAKSDYLMRFDNTGHELIASNSYTDFSVGSNLSEEYRAVLMGYPYIVVGPSADPYTGRIQIGTAILMTDNEGQPNGFLLAVYGAGELNAELKRLSYENAINHFPVQNKSHVAAAINNETGRFIAHTDPEMIDQKAEDFFDDMETVSSFEGFTDYKDEDVYLSAVSTREKTLLFMVPERWVSGIHTDFTLSVLAVLLLLSLLYYPIASVLMSKAIAEADEKLQPYDTARTPISIFLNGYYKLSYSVCALRVYCLLQQMVELL